MTQSEPIPQRPLRVRLVGSPPRVADWAGSLCAAGVGICAPEESADVVLQVATGDHAASLHVREQRLVAPGIPIVVAGVGDDPALVRALWHAGAADVLFEGERDGLPAALARAVERHRLAEATQLTFRRYTTGLGERSRRLEVALAQLERSYEETLRALILALDAREQETAGHSHRVALWTLHFSIVAGVPEEQLLDIHRGALLHDIGKIGIPDPILLKRGELTPEEWAVMRTHPRIGHDILAQVAHLSAASAIPFSHHERYDGAGYPRGLKAGEIPLGARLFAIVDVYDALRSERSYKRAFSHEESLAILRREAGSHLDPVLVDLFVALPQSTWVELAAPNLATMTYPQLRALARTVGARIPRDEPVEPTVAP